jgi:hypothetical protein
MTPKHFLAPVSGAVAVLAVSVLSGMMLLRSPQIHADEGGDDESKIHQGFAIAPVPLNLEGKDRRLVGLGSYIVNAVADCNGCHSAGPATEYSPGGNPYLLSPAFSGKQVVNPATYLAGGQDFGPFPGPPFPSIPHLYSRNLTPDMTGLPEGGHTFEQFRQIMRQGTDFDHVHPNCTAGPGTPPNCLEPPFNGDLLQVMPWPSFENMSEHHLRAIYEYLRAIPCNSGPVIDGAPYLQNVCN